MNPHGARVRLAREGERVRSSLENKSDAFVLTLIRAATRTAGDRYASPRRRNRAHRVLHHARLEALRRGIR